MAEYTPLFKPGAAVTYHASADISGGQIVELTGDRTVGPAAADSAKVVGVAGFDTTTGDSVTVFDGGIQRATASGAITAGTKVAAAADGKAAAVGASTNAIGLALTAAADGELVQIKFQA